jgi:hypothetical protein
MRRAYNATFADVRLVIDARTRGERAAADDLGRLLIAGELQRVFRSRARIPPRNPNRAAS